jgi:hypothetical protein
MRTQLKMRAAAVAHQCVTQGAPRDICPSLWVSQLLADLFTSLQSKSVGSIRAIGDRASMRRFQVCIEWLAIVLSARGTALAALKHPLSAARKYSAWVFLSGSNFAHSGASSQAGNVTECFLALP